MSVTPDQYATRTLRFNLLLCSILFFVVTLIGSGLNNQSHKYSVAKVASIADCQHEVFNRHIADSSLCCDKSYHEWDWLCVASTDRLSKVVTSRWAFLLPLVPWLSTFFIDMLLKNSSRPTNNLWLASRLQRLALYISLIAFRTVSCRVFVKTNANVGCVKLDYLVFNASTSYKSLSAGSSESRLLVSASCKLAQVGLSCVAVQ